MKLAIVGSRRFTDYVVFSRFLKLMIDQQMQGNTPTHIVSGGADGIDSLARQYARENGIELIEFLPKDKSRDALMARNTEIVDECDVLFAFPDDESKGTWDSVRKAKKKFGPLERVFIKYLSRASLKRVRDGMPELYKQVQDKKRKKQSTLFACLNKKLEGEKE